MDRVSEVFAELLATFESVIASIQEIFSQLSGLLSSDDGTSST
ncbi:MAG: hypothetical protein R3Y27_05045 [Clostridia bacterium]